LHPTFSYKASVHLLHQRCTEADVFWFWKHYDRSAEFFLFWYPSIIIPICDRSN